MPWVEEGRAPAVREVVGRDPGDELPCGWGKYGVSDNAVRKRVRFYEREMERKATEAEAAADQA